MVELSNAVNSRGKISVRISLCGDFSRIMCRFSSIVTVACIDLDDWKIPLNNLNRLRNVNDEETN